jgi:hypothetical protein
MHFRYIEPLYGFDAGTTHICVPETAVEILRTMVDELLGTGDLIGIYIPEGTEEVYRPGAMRGRIVGAVRLVAKPHGKAMRDYFYKDWDGTLRWPIGWPCKAVYAPPVEQCPVLRSLVDMLFGPNDFHPYVSRFQNGPFALDRRMASELDRRFSSFPQLP